MSNFITDNINKEVVNIDKISFFHPYIADLSYKSRYHIYFYMADECVVAWKYRDRETHLMVIHLLYKMVTDIGK